MQTLEKFLGGSDVSMRCREVIQSGQLGSLITEPWTAKQFLCELFGSNGDRPISTIIGSDNDPPEMSEVLDALAVEAAVVEETGCFEEWAAQLGYDPDSRHGERIYDHERRQAKRLRELLGDERYRRLLWETERL